VAMESYAASDMPPVDASLADLRNSDVLVGIVAWRYGYIPAGLDRSITDLEIQAARAAHIPCLLFLVRDDASWPMEFIDRDTTRIREFRNSLLRDFVVGWFASPDELAAQVAQAVHNWTARGAIEPPQIPPAESVSEIVPGPEVFLSYAHEDVAFAEAVAERLVQQKWSVFWDRQIPVGLTWDDIVEEALDSAKCVVVLWSPASRDSEWVRIEANEGAARHILAPALIANVKIPLRFRRIQAADLVGWIHGMADTSGMKTLIAAVERCLTTSRTVA